MALKGIPEGEVVRFTPRQRIQHLVLMISMIGLSLTGLALKFHDTWLGRLVIQLEGGIATRGILHRIFAGLLMVVGAYHIFYVLFTEEGHRELMALKPRWQDFRDFWESIRYNLGLRSDPVAFGKYDWRQKFQYWGVVVGFWVMVITGFILWFESASMAVLPKWLIDVTLIFHGWEGLLIFLVLFLYHLYNVHLNPDSFPLSKTWYTGKMSIKDLYERHRLEYEERYGHQEGSESD